MIYLASDHGGYTKKKIIVSWLQKRGFKVHDVGPLTMNPRDDYPVWAKKVARRVQQNADDKGILLCRSGVGMAIAANKFTNVRATQAFSPAMAKHSRIDENANVISLAADYQSVQQMKKIILAWLSTGFTAKPRHQRRLRELNRLEHAS